MIVTSSQRPLPPAVADRLVRIAGMLGSSHAGEAANAASAATKIIKEGGLTWAQVIRTGIAAPPPQQRPAPRHEPTGWRGDAAACLARADLLSAWKAEFLAGLRRFPHLSPKQEVILARLVERVRAAGGEP